MLSIKKIIGRPLPNQETQRYDQDVIYFSLTEGTTHFNVYVSSSDGMSIFSAVNGDLVTTELTRDLLSMSSGEDIAAALSVLSEDSVVNLLDSDDPESPLSAAQGKALKEELNGIRIILGDKEWKIIPSTDKYFYSGEKTWVKFDTAVLGLLLGALPSANGVPVEEGDSLLIALAKLQAQLGNYLSKAQGGVIDGGVKFNSKQSVSNVALGASSVIDCNAGTYFSKTVSAATTFSFSNLPAANEVYALNLVIYLSSGSISFPSSVKFPDNEFPTLATSKYHLFTLVTDNGGNSWRGSLNSNYSG